MNRFTLVGAIAALMNCSPDYESGRTKCSLQGDCPDGFVCGDDSYPGASSVCYEIDKTTCPPASAYYCPKSSTCWTSRVACDTVGFCGIANPKSRVSKSYSLSNSDKCARVLAPCAWASTDTACDRCLEAACCPQLKSCLNQTSCITLATCVSDCSSGNTTCISNCKSSNSAGLTTLTTFDSCITTSCSSTCN